jgi:transposase-like protein
MTTPRRRHSPEFKAKAALEAIRGQRTLNEIASDLGVHPMQLTQWKKQALEALPELFANGRAKKSAADQAQAAALYEEIGRLKVALDWLKKRAGSAR